MPRSPCQHFLCEQTGHRLGARLALVPLCPQMEDKEMTFKDRLCPRNLIASWFQTCFDFLKLQRLYFPQVVILFPTGASPTSESPTPDMLWCFQAQLHRRELPSSHPAKAGRSLPLQPQSPGLHRRPGPGSRTAAAPALLLHGTGDRARRLAASTRLLSPMVAQTGGGGSQMRRMAWPARVQAASIPATPVSA